MSVAIPIDVLLLSECNRGIASRSSDLLRSSRSATGLQWLSAEHEFLSGWVPCVRYALATDTGTSLKEVAVFGLSQVYPFRRHGDMFGAAFNYSEPSSGKRYESVFESFYRPRLTQSIDLGPDVEVSIHPYATMIYTTTHLSVRMRIIFEWPNTRRLRDASRTVALLVWSRWRPCNRQMPTAQYGHDSEPEA